MKSPEEILKGKIILSYSESESSYFESVELKDVLTAMNEYADQFRNPPKKTIEERKKEFWRSCCNVVGEFSDSLILAFYEYWTEHSEGAKKMRFEKEKVFDIKKRLDRWKRNQKTSYGKSTKPTRIDVHQSEFDRQFGGSDESGASGDSIIEDAGTTVIN